ncbi:MAG: hypothetical protein DHS20C18_19510 [Saprospiraceae bacterium]|nr:MAG: hypothetical protein DHS20C18_19510 [Saprospiraceae bacterium]
MMKALIVLQTIWLASLTIPVNGFNISLSFGHPTTSPYLNSGASFFEGSDSASAIEMVGKVIKESNIDEKEYRIKTVVIDPGHGGHDPGCLGHSSREKHLALGIALKVAEGLKLNFPEINVIMTRDTDVFIPLHERAAIANRNNADLFISIHCNYMPGHSGTNGSETYVMGLHTAQHNLEVAKRENSAILLEDNYEKNYDFDPNSSEGHILLSMFQNAYLEQSILFADRVEARIGSDAARKSRGVKQAGFVVLKETAMPSVLVEAGFLSSYKEEKFLKTEEGQQVMADAIIAAFAEYKIMVETGSYDIPPGVKTIPVASKENKTTQPAPTPDRSIKTVAVKTEEIPVQSTSIPAKTRADSPSEPIKDWERALIEDKANRVAVATRPTPPPPTPVSSPVPATTYPNDYNNPQIYKERKIIPMQGSNVPESSMQITVKSPPPSSTTVKPQNRPATILQDNQNIRFNVQLAASPSPIDTNQPKWRSLEYQIEIVPEGNLFKYQARNFDNYYQALDAKLHLQNRGFADAFIVVYKDGRKISLEQAKLELGIQ